MEHTHEKVTRKGTAEHIRLISMAYFHGVLPSSVEAVTLLFFFPTVLRRRLNLTLENFHKKTIDPNFWKAPSSMHKKIQRLLKNIMEIILIYETSVLKDTLHHLNFHI